MAPISHQHRSGSDTQLQKLDFRRKTLKLPPSDKKYALLVAPKRMFACGFLAVKRALPLHVTEEEFNTLYGE